MNNKRVIALSLGLLISMPAFGTFGRFSNRFFSSRFAKPIALALFGAGSFSAGSYVERNKKTQIDLFVKPGSDITLNEIICSQFSSGLFTNKPKAIKKHTSTFNSPKGISTLFSDPMKFLNGRITLNWKRFDEKEKKKNLQNDTQE